MNGPHARDQKDDNQSVPARYGLVGAHDRACVATSRSANSIAYDARFRAFTQKWQDLRVISLRIAGKSPWLRDECVTVLADLSRLSPDPHAHPRLDRSVRAARFGAARE